jgi:hypothetical protein
MPLNSTKSLHCWRVMEAVSPWDIRTRHVCGQNATGSAGISTSAIQEFDPVAKTIKTRSGNTYTLVGQPDNSRLGEAAWNKWCNDNGIVSQQDMTSEYLNANSAQASANSAPMDADPSPTITFKRVGFGVAS